MSKWKWVYQKRGVRGEPTCHVAVMVFFQRDVFVTTAALALSVFLNCCTTKKEKKLSSCSNLIYWFDSRLCFLTVCLLVCLFPVGEVHPNQLWCCWLHCWGQYWNLYPHNLAKRVWSTAVRLRHPPSLKAGHKNFVFVFVFVGILLVVVTLFMLAVEKEHQ